MTMTDFSPRRRASKTAKTAYVLSIVNTFAIVVIAIALVILAL